MPAHDLVWSLLLAGGDSRRLAREQALSKQGGQTQLRQAVGVLERRLSQAVGVPEPLNRRDTHLVSKSGGTEDQRHASA